MENMDSLIESSGAATRNQMFVSRKKNRGKCVTVIAVASIVVVAMIMCEPIGVNALSRSREGYVAAQELEPSIEIESVCSPTLYPESCRVTLSSYLTSSSNGVTLQNKQQVLHIAAMVAMKEANRAFVQASAFFNQTHYQIAVGDCVELIDITKDQLSSSLSLLQQDGMNAREHSEVRALLSAAITNMETCHDGILEKSDGKSEAGLLSSVERVKVFASNCLAILVNTKSNWADKLALPSTPIKEGFPWWVSAADRRILQTSANDINADVVVAADGSGNFKTITEAINKAPEKSSKRHVIKVKKGTYKEYVEVGKTKTNILLIGEGMKRTIVTGSRNVVDGSTTFKSATFAVVGKGFMAQDIAFVNTAGPKKHQAVALRVGSDQSVFYRCKIAGHQDTLYTHSLRQFYRECLVLGTVDFIFGNSAVVLQSCTLLPRKPGQSQKNAITAQGRTDPNQDTGISIHSCNITADSDLVPVKTSFPTYLGRPWKEYSRTVYMQSFLGDAINPAGWLEWSGDFALKTLYYGEYKNSGAGARTGNRVKWGGYHVIKSSKEAIKFTVDEFIQGNEWLQATGVDYITGLTD
uniref:Pectinesterase n=1 Tax=Cunninghamia lanceolata TaxID=28977 RepID=A0A6G9W3I1_CUNLA|nr:pectin methylesterase 33 [Cunninghamia lanceolata]